MVYMSGVTVISSIYLSYYTDAYVKLNKTFDWAGRQYNRCDIEEQFVSTNIRFNTRGRFERFWIGASNFFKWYLDIL